MSESAINDPGLFELPKEPYTDEEIAQDTYADPIDVDEDAIALRGMRRKLRRTLGPQLQKYGELLGQLPSTTEEYHARNLTAYLIAAH